LAPQNSARRERRKKFRKTFSTQGITCKRAREEFTKSKKKEVRPAIKSHQVFRRRKQQRRKRKKKRAMRAGWAESGGLNNRLCGGKERRLLRHVQREKEGVQKVIGCTERRDLERGRPVCMAGKRKNRTSLAKSGRGGKKKT